MKKSWLDAAKIFLEESQRFLSQNPNLAANASSMAAHRAYFFSCSRRMQDEAGWDFEEWRCAPIPNGQENAYLKLAKSIFGN